MIRILIVDDHPIVRKALRSLITENNMLVVGETESSDDVLDILRKTDCDLLMLDISMSGKTNEIELIKEISRGDEVNPSILIFSTSNDRQTAISAINAGASGYITKRSEPDQIIKAIRKVAAKGKFICPDIAEQILFAPEPDEATLEAPHKNLSPREHQVFLQLLDGKSIDVIAAELFISRQTVGTHKMRIMQKLKLKSNVDMVRYGIKHGLLSC